MDMGKIDLSIYDDDEVVFDLPKLLKNGSGNVYNYVVHEGSYLDKIMIWDQPADNLVYIICLTCSDRKLPCRRDAVLTKKFIRSLKTLNDLDEINRNGIFYYGKPTGDEDYVQFEKESVKPTTDLNHAPISILDLPLGRTLKIPLKYRREKYFLDVDKCSEYAVMDFYHANHDKKPVKSKYDPEAKLLTCFIKPNVILNWGAFSQLRYYGDRIDKTQTLAQEHSELVNQLFAFSEFDKASF